MQNLPPKYSKAYTDQTYGSFYRDPNKVSIIMTNHNFFVLNKNKKLTKTKVDLTVSLDVLYHLIEDIVYENYIKNLFNSESKFIIIYSCNFEDDGTFAKHVKPRKFTDHQFINQKYDLIHFEKNKYGDKKNTDTYSMSDWYIYKIKE